MGNDAVLTDLESGLRSPELVTKHLSERLIDRTLGDKSGVDGRIVVKADYGATQTSLPVTITSTRPVKSENSGTDFDALARKLADGMAANIDANGYTSYDRDVRKTMVEKQTPNGIEISLVPTEIEKGTVHRRRLENAVETAYRQTVDSHPGLAALEGAAIGTGNGRS